MDASEEARKLAEARHAAREKRDFATADQLRDRIGELGFELRDTPAGFELTLKASPIAASVHLLYEGFRSDLERFLGGLDRTDVEVVVVDDRSTPDGEWLETLGVTVVPIAPENGWAEARNAGAAASRGDVLIFADLSVEPKGDIAGPLIASLENPSVVVAGPWGLRSADMRTFEESPGPDVDAIEGYLMAVRRDDFLPPGFDPWFRWYRHADLDVSFRLRASGGKARVVEVPAERHDHRGWAAVPEPERSRLSKRNFYRFLDHWKDREDLLVRHGA